MINKLLALAVLSLGAIGASGQIQIGSIKGAITDPAGAAVTDANVWLTNSITGEKVGAIIDGAGGFVFNNVPFNRYMLRIEAKGKLPPIPIGTSRDLIVGQRVYAIGTQGAREGREPILSEGVISSLRPYRGSQYIEISALISPASSGGGLFDDQGRLIGILSRQFIEGQHLTFALPVDWISELAKEEPTALAPTKENGLNWLSRALVLEKKADWRGLVKLSRQEVKRNPANSAAWFSLGVAFANLKQYDQAIPAYREAIRNEDEYGDAWHNLGVAYANLKEYDNAIQAYEDALRMQPDNAGIWYDLGNTYYNIKRYAHAVHAYRDALRIQPENPDAWYSLGNTYDALKLYGETIEAYRETVRIQPENVDAWYSLGVAYARLDERDKMREIYQTLRKLDPARAERYFNTYILP